METRADVIGIIATVVIGIAVLIAVSLWIM